MVHSSQLWLLCSVTLLLASSLPNSQARVKNGNGVRTAVFLSPKFEQAPGSVVNKFFYNVDFPRGHIALKNFNAEVVDEVGNPIPLHETYLHHWVVFRYYQLKGVEVPKHNGNMGFHPSDFITVPNSGLCENNLGQYFGLGSETRKTATHVPEPYGIEVGNPAEIPPGYEERWLMNVHGIDTRGVEDPLGCTECRCELYNVTQDEYGRALRPGYKGGLKCCYDQTQCRMREGIESAKRGLYMRYTVTWVDWDASVVPVKIYIFDVTDIWKKLDGSTDAKHHCLVEYEVESCSATGVTNDGCIDTKRVSLSLPTGGNVIYGVAHQHTGGIGSTLYGEDGRVICSSIPTYGEGKEAGNEAGYIVGMSTCYPRPGSVQISDGETLVLVSNYSRSVRGHTGVMGLFYILVADASPKPKPFLQAPVEVQMQGVADGRAVDLTALDGYASLIDELEKMFEIKGELRPRNRWEVVYMDDEGDMMLLGDDDPWPEFCVMVRKIFICSSEEVKKMGPRYKLPVSSLGGEGAIKHETMTLPVSLWGVALFGVAIVAAVVVGAYRRRSEREAGIGYQSIVM